MKVLFVCTGNRFRSLGAELFAREKKPELDVFSRGINPSPEVLDVVKEELKEREVADPGAYDPTEIREEDLKEADLVVAMTSRHENFITENFDTDTEIVNWEVPDVEADMPEEELREKVSSTYDIIERKVEEL